MATKIEYPSAVDFGALAAQDWQDAQVRFQKAVSGGYDEQTAAALYLAPIQSKWQIIQKNPTEFQDKSKLDKISSDFDTATANAVKSLDRNSSAADVLAPRLNPLISQWSAVGIEPSLTPAQQLQLRSLQSDIGKEETQQNRYETAATFFGINGDEAKMKAAQDAADRQAQKIAGMKSAADALMLGTSRTGTGQRLDSIGETGTAAVPTIPLPDNIVGYTNPDVTTPGGFLGLRQPPFIVGNGTEGVPAPQPSAEPASAALTKKPVIFISGRPDLSNVTREEADASWLAAHPQSMNRPAAAVLSTPSDVEPESAGNEVERMTKDGRRAIFDSRTRKFIRYAD